jgi:hypothetical protein
MYYTVILCVLGSTNQSTYLHKTQSVPHTEHSVLQLESHIITVKRQDNTDYHIPFYVPTPDKG